MTGTRRVAAALASSRGLFAIAVLMGLLCSVGFLGVGTPTHTVVARFADADGLVSGNEVRVAGIVAGVVDSVSLGTDADGSQYAEVSLEVDSDHWPLHEGTKLAVKPKGVLSNVFVELDPGPGGNPSLGNQPFFGVDQTQSPVNLDEFTNVFTPSVRDSIRTQLQEGVLAFAGAGATELNDILSNANPLTLDAIPVTDVLATRSPQLDNLNYEFDTTTGELARENANLQPLITNLDATLGALATQEINLQGTLVHAGNVFDDLSSALSSPATQADLERVFQGGPEALSCATAISTYLTPLITAVNPYISFSAPYSLNTLLGDFVTASGYNTVTARGLDLSHLDTLRVLPIADTPPPDGPIFHDAGGLTLEHGGLVNASTTGGAANVYEEQPANTKYPTMSGCTPPAGLP